MSLGKLLINGIFSFNFASQRKRFIGSISALHIRYFIGSLTADIEKAVLIITRSFTRAAREEASTSRKLQIDLMDGDDLISKIVECRLGVKEKTIYEINKSFLRIYEH